MHIHQLGQGGHFLWPCAARNSGRKVGRWTILVALLIMCVRPGVCAERSRADPVGDYSALLGTIHLTLHLTRGAGGVRVCLLDSPDQGRSGIPCAAVGIDEQSLSFTVPSVGGKWIGKVSDDGRRLSGTWTQGESIPVDFTLVAARPVSPTGLDGTWLGQLPADGRVLRIQVHIRTNGAGLMSCSLDSIDQHFRTDCDAIRYQEPTLTFDFLSIKGHWEGRLSDDGDTLLGTWRQGMSFPLNLARQLP